MSNTTVNIYVIEDEIIIAHEIAAKIGKLGYTLWGRFLAHELGLEWYK